MDNFSNHSPWYNLDSGAAPDSPRPVPGRGKKNPSDNANDLGATSKGKLDAKSLAYPAAKMTLRGVKEAADAFPPLKSATAVLCFILDNCEVPSTFRTHNEICLYFS